MKTRCLVAAVLATLMLQPVLAQEGDDTGWSDIADFSFVLTSGNSETETLAFNNTLVRKWSKAAFTFKAGALKAENTTKFGVRNGTGGIDIMELTATTAENYYAALKYDRDISKRTFWYVGGGWLRNEFAGIKDRYTGSAGIGNKWIDKDGLKFSTEYGVSYTDQTDLVQTMPPTDRTFAGALVGWNYLNDIGENATYTNDFGFNYNLEESEDWRWVMEQALTVAMSEKLALKVSLLWLYNNLPASQVYTVADGGIPASITVPLDELDSIFGVSLVVKF